MIDLKCPYPDLAEALNALPEEKKYHILQAVSNLRLENMEPTRQTWQNILDEETGRKTDAEIFEDIRRRHFHG